MSFGKTCFSLNVHKLGCNTPASEAIYFFPAYFDKMFHLMVQKSKNENFDSPPSVTAGGFVRTSCPTLR